jgi:hypothetical protein
MSSAGRTRGVITLAQGSDEYMMLAGALLKSLRLNAPDESVAVITDRPDHPVTHRFDHQIALRPERGVAFAQKLNLCDYTPYDDTLYVDADCLAYGALDELWDDFAGTSSVGVLARRTPTPWWCPDLTRLPPEYQLESYLEFNGGLYFLRAGPAATAVFEEARDVYARSREYGLVMFGDLPGDEPAVALALSRAGAVVIDDHGRGMRTPSALSGRPRLDIAGRQAEFVKWGARVNPVLVHFAGGRWRRPAYREQLLALQLAARGVPRPVAGAMARSTVGLAPAARRALRRARRRPPIDELAPMP